MPEFEIRYQYWLRGRRSQRTIRVQAENKTEAEQVFLKGYPENRVKILAVFPARSRLEG